MWKHTTTALIFAVLVCGPAAAACPPEVPGSLPEAVRANGERIVCLQNELAATTAQQKYEFELKALQDKIQTMQLEQRLNALPTVPVYVPPPVMP